MACHLPKKLLTWWGSFKLEKDCAQWSPRCLLVGVTLSTSIIHLRGHGYTNDPSSWGATSGPFLSTLTWCSFPLESYSGDSLLFGISWPPAWEHWSLTPNQDLEEGVWRVPAIVPPSFPRALMLGVKSASLMLCLFLSAPLAWSVTGCWKTNNTAPAPPNLGYYVSHLERVFLFPNNWFTNKLLEFCPPTPPPIGLAEVTS